MAFGSVTVASTPRSSGSRHINYLTIGIEYDEKGDYVVIKHVTLFTSTIISKLLARPNVKLFNAMAVAYLIVKEGRVCGVVPSMNHDTRSPCLKPKGIKAKLVVSSYGLDGLFGATAVNKLRSIGVIGIVLQMNTLDTNATQDAIVS
ncbi:hypothetical protein Nepgr_026177 [Nepenthes gracilis]|uniref:Uncharacterized protein n=1 Tax=Nepenthes gracilis TaxID=150966 RepID=A0AAD3T8F5_NEPGR|nr:hypothetical protein Nepgr_026177 [Nepenthes gracilis]